MREENREIGKVRKWTKAHSPRRRVFTWGISPKKPVPKKVAPKRVVQPIQKTEQPIEKPVDEQVLSEEAIKRIQEQGLTYMDQ
jgi:hypothetical protein